MKKQLLTIPFIVVSIIFSVSCSKKSSSNSSTPTPTGSQVTINSKTYSAGSFITVPNDTALISGTFTPSISSSGSYANYTYTQTVKGVKVYTLFYLQANIPTAGDTVISGVLIESGSPITTGTYTIYGVSNLPTNSTTIASVTYYETNANYNDSLATGTLTITNLDTVNKKMSGTYSYTASGTKGSTPATLTVTNGQFNNVSLQEF